MSPKHIDETSTPETPSRVAPAAPAPMLAGAAFPPLTDQAVLVATARGTIEYGTDAARRLLQAADRRLEGESLATLLPELPLRAATPGYNCAYLVFNHPPGRWHPLTVATPDGGSVTLEAAFLFIPLGDTTRILVGLRTPTPGSADDAHFQRFLARMETSDDAVVVTDAEGVVEYVNPAYERLSGWRREALVGRPRRPAALATTTAAPGAGSQVRDTLRTERTRSGRALYLDEQVRPFTDRSGHVTHYVCTARDVSRRIASERALQRRANFDSLTGIANRHLLIHRLNQELSRAAREGGAFAVVCADMDGLKAINDAFGHAAGDAAIRAVAERLTHCVRDMDTVGRFGGDEFLLVVPGLHRPADVDALLGKLVASVRDARVGDAAPVRLALSAGAALYPRDGRDAGALVQAADAAMYTAKRLGGDRHWSCVGLAPSPAAAERAVTRCLQPVPVLPRRPATAVQHPSVG
ncbi:diguanylate cyclase [Nitrogeniibacter mangrovi]|uniref:Diguanylate cyclase n=1 Tax=Nitrogeniibacter mangrovi TaxID=2016596 RepID=A0A6C1AZM9_9RHOO|nr:diguanylate cyclase [Nitrogeniibacter mangrovi]QID16816.1 diguanylate cyclase [Nitrogeniibacter mangrovi]